MFSDSHITAETVSLLIPIVAIIMGIGLVMLSICLDFLKKRDILNAVHRERLAAIEKGMEPPALPPEIFRGRDRRPRSAARTLERGLVLMFVGIAISVALWRTGKNDAWWGLVPFALGLAYLISSRFRAAELTRTGSEGLSESDRRSH